MRSAFDMTGLLEMAMVAARDLPAEMQGEITRLILAYPGSEAPALLAPDEDADSAAHPQVTDKIARSTAS